MIRRLPCSRPLLLDAALQYHAVGLSVIPAGREKRPLVPWAEYQSRRPSREEIERWWHRWPTANIAAVTGTASGRVVLDLDPRNFPDSRWGDRFLEELACCPPIVDTPSGGVHLHFSAPLVPVRSVNGLRPGVDLKADGGIVLLPPSELAIGRYTWRGGDQAQPPLAPLPAVVERWLVERARSARGLVGLAGGGAGRRAPARGCPDITAVLSRLRRVRQTPRGGWVASCPGPNHRRADRRPSLAIGQGVAGLVLLHCFGAPACLYAEILEALGL